MNIEDILKRVISDGDTVLDVGGHVGNVAWFMTRCTGPTGRVFSFEPHPELFKSLHAKAEKYTTLEAVNCAVSNSLKPVTLYFGVTEASNQASTIRADLVTTELLGDEIHSTQVQAVTLDTFCAERDLHPAVIKIDVEGAEAFVLEGAIKILDAKPTLIFEMGVTQSLPAHVAQLCSRGYELYFIDIHQFVTVPASWNHIVNTESRALRDCLIRLSDATAEQLVPFLSNVLAIAPENRTALAGLRIMTLAKAAPLFADPRKSTSRKFKRIVRQVLMPPAVEERFPGLVACIRNFARRIL